MGLYACLKSEEQSVNTWLVTYIDIYRSLTQQAPELWGRPLRLILDLSLPVLLDIRVTNTLTD